MSGVGDKHGMTHRRGGDNSERPVTILLLWGNGGLDAERNQFRNDSVTKKTFQGGELESMWQREGHGIV